MKLSVYECPSCNKVWTSEIFHFHGVKHGCEREKEVQAYPSEGEMATGGSIKMTMHINHAPSELMGSFMIDDAVKKFETKKKYERIIAEYTSLVIKKYKYNQLHHAPANSGETL